MKAVIFALLCMSVFAEDDLYTEFLHGKTIANRMRTIREFNKKNEKMYQQLERSERKILNKLDLYYRDMRVAVSLKDRYIIEQKISFMQKGLQEIRKQKRIILRRMRRMTDSIGAEERDLLVRRGRVESKVGLEKNIHIRREIEENQRLLLKETKALATKYAFMAAQIASAKKQEQLKKNPKGKLLEAEDQLKQLAEKTYNIMYKKIVGRIEEATSEGVTNENIKLACRNAIDGLIRKLEHDNLIYIVSKEQAQKEAPKVIAKPIQNSIKALSKDFKKTNTQTTKTITKSEKKDLKNIN